MKKIIVISTFVLMYLGLAAQKTTNKLSPPPALAYNLATLNVNTYPDGSTFRSCKKCGTDCYVLECNL